MKRECWFFFFTALGWIFRRDIEFKWYTFQAGLPLVSKDFTFMTIISPIIIIYTLLRKKDNKALLRAGNQLQRFMGIRCWWWLCHSAASFNLYKLRCRTSVLTFVMNIRRLDECNIDITVTITGEQC
jgi:hypothetical protein